ncbi:MAG: hypothetical protein Q7S44_02775 [bacterium]|nr:hypothetical protein [bacterium]
MLPELLTMTEAITDYRSMVPTPLKPEAVPVATPEVAESLSQTFSLKKELTYHWYRYSKMVDEEDKVSFIPTRVPQAEVSTIVWNT